MANARSSAAGEKFRRLVEIMARLRAPDGCPWDREQTFDSIKPYTLEETYEVLDAIDSRDWKALADELGDLMLQAVFLARIAEEEGTFSIEDSLDAIVEKLVRRHPHVFADGDAKTAGEVKQRWDEIKRQENREKPASRPGLLDNVPRSMPALVEAQQLTSRASTVGFDWENPDQVLAKLDEELKELAESRRRGLPDEIEHELGDLLFAVVNLARLLKVDAEQALRGTNAKFRGRFGYLERKLNARGRPLSEATLEEMDQLWEEAKRQT
ncbi:MAG TPA: nucleoside triphosphate pyrophosphohydrolase [Bryobacteraceae bacterium]|nr:nucleoside triphosphate pyrophosphohydrolase [Bryobacteraceae bacterium]